MISTFYGEHGSPDGATQDAYDKFEMWQSHHQVEILQISTAAVGQFGEASCFGFWLTVLWQWEVDDEDRQRWRAEGLAAAAAIVLHELDNDGVQTHSRDLLASAVAAYEAGKRAQS